MTAEGGIVYKTRCRLIELEYLVEYLVDRIPCR